MNDSKGIIHWLFLKKWHPVPTVASTVALFSIIGVLFLILGIVITVINNQIIEVSLHKYNAQVDFNNEEQCQLNNATKNYTCTVEWVLPEIKAPIYFYYELENFYQNHRRYVSSKSSTQLSGTPIGSSDASTFCSPIKQESDLWDYQQKIHIDVNNKRIPRTANKTNVANPCGLIAKSFFNDTYKLFKEDGKTQVTIDETGISWPNDVGKKYQASPNTSTTQWINPENEHFIVWMRTAGLPQFRKLWGHIEEDLPAGTYKLQFEHNYDQTKFNGAKNIVMSTSGPFGGKNLFLAVAFIVVGVIQILIAIAFLIKKLKGGNSFGVRRAE